METSSNDINISDQGQREAFLNELSQFLADKGRYICRTPNLAGRTIDLHDLYNKITAAGGYQKVTDRGFWEDFLEHYGFPSYSVTLAYGLQKIYQLYLEDYERVHFFGDDEPQPFSRNYLGVYRRFRHPITASQRIQLNMNMEKASVSDYDRVVLSLESCLPNEIDFAVNACTLLSGESRHVLRLPQCRKIVDALLLHAGIVSDELDSYREVLTELQNKTKHNYRKFWSNSISKKSVLTTLLPLREDENLPQNKDIVPLPNTESEIETFDEKRKNNDDFVDALQKRLMNIEEGPSVGDFSNGDTLNYVKKRSKWSELFHGHRSLGVQDYEGQRVLQIALVLLNLSFEDFNVTLLAQHISLIRFVFLCIHSEYSCLRQTGLDILSNISSRMQLLHLHYDMITMMFDSINSAVLSNDKFERIRGFEILGNICRPRPNVDYVCVYVSEKVYESAVQNLMVQDVELLLSSIEALYRLSKLGETTCTKIIFIKGCIDILVCLVTLNVRTFGADKLAEIRLARRITSAQQQPQQQQPTQQPMYQVPGAQPVLQHQIQRQIHYQQQQPKLGSVHQAQPMVAAAAPKISAPTATSAIVQAKQPIPPQPTVNPTPMPQSQVEPPPPSKTPQPSQPTVITSQANTSKEPPKPIMSPTPTPTTPPIVKSSPPGAGPTYTHSETGTVPPVFHYMPAPPTDIVQDSSPESFTKLWIWATYEFDAESYIPRVDVYCEYLASSNRYGRQGKTEVLSATDFGKCLKQIFPNAASRLFNQGRGQPQYHIAGIKKRATPLPVPGYQLKDPSSVFSSEYEKIPTTKSQAPITVSSSTQQTTTVPSTTPPVQNATTPPAVAPVLPTAVPIQQLQFQPVLIVSQVPGTNNVALVQGMQCQTVNSGQVMVAQTLDGQAVALTGQGVVQTSVAPNVQNAVSGEITTSNVETVAPTSQATASVAPAVCASSAESKTQCESSVAPNAQCVISSVHTATCVTSVASTEQCVASLAQNSQCDTAAVTTDTATPISQTVTSKCAQNTAVSNSKLDTNCNKTATTTCNSCNDKVVTSNEVTKQSKGTVMMPRETGATNSNNHSSASENIEQDKQLLNNNGPKLAIPNPDVILSCEKQNHIEQDSEQKNKTVSKDEIIAQSETDKCQKDEANGKTNVLAESDNNKEEIVPIMNGYPEPMESEDTSTTTSIKSKSLEQEIDSTSMEVDSSKSQKSVAQTEEAPLVNGFCEEKRTTVNGDSEYLPSEGGKEISSSHPCLEGSKENSITEDVGEIVKVSEPNATKTESDKIVSAKIPIPQIDSAESVLASSTEITNSLQESNSAVENTELETKLHSENEQKNVESINAEAAPQTPIHCVAMTPTTQTLNSGSELTDPVTPKNPIPHSALNQRLKETITRRKNSQSIIATPSNTNTTPVNVNLPAPSIIQQYSYKAPGEGSSLVQQIIPITPQQLQQQYHQQRLPNTNIGSTYQGTPPQIGTKRPHPQATVSLGAPPVKVLRPTLNTPVYTPTASSATPPNHVHYQQQPHSSQVQVGVITTPRHALPPNSIPRPPRPQVPQQHHMPPRPNTPVPNPHQVPQQKPKPPTIDLMAPNASLLVLYRNVGKIPFANHLDEKEDAISKSIRLTASLILTNIARHSHLGRGLIQKHEEQLANVAMSQMDCSPIVARLLSEIDL